MRRSLLALFLILVTLLALFHQDAAHFLIRSIARIHSGATISYQELRLSRKTLTLRGLTVSKPNTYLLNAAEVTLSYYWPCSLKVHIHEPHLSLSTTLLNHTSASEKGAICLSIEVEGGILEWMDAQLPSARFNLKKTDSHTELSLIFDQGSLQFENGRVNWTDLPCELIPILASLKNNPLPINKCRGLLSGSFDGAMLHAEGSGISFQTKEALFKGSFSLDWQKSDTYSSFSLIPERIRLSIQNGKISTPLTSVKNITLLSTFQSGNSAMCECHAICGNLPLSFLAKGFFLSETDGWIKGDLSLGNASADLAWKVGDGILNWKGASTQEISFLREFGQAFDSRLASLDWVAGTIGGRACIKETIQLESVLATDLFLTMDRIPLECKRLILQEGDWNAEEISINGFQGNGSWSALKQELSIAGAWNGIASSVYWSLDESVRAYIGDLQLLGKTLFSDHKLRIQIPQITGKLPNFSDFQGTIASGGIDLTLSYSNSLCLDEWSASCKLVDGALSNWSCSGLELDLLADDSALDLSGKGFFTAPNGFKLQLNAPKIRVSGDTAIFDVRLEDENLVLLRAVGAKEGNEIQLDGDKSHLFGSKFAARDLIWENGTLSKGYLDSVVHWPTVALFLEKAGMPEIIEIPFKDLRIEGDFTQKDRLGITFSSDGYVVTAGYKDNLWKIAMANDRLTASCDLSTSPDALFQIKKGVVSHKDLLSFSFEGKVLNGFSADLFLENIEADISIFQIDGLKGLINGRGCMTVNSHGIESDLDINPATICWNDLQFDSINPIHLSCSSEKGALIKGLAIRASKGSLEARGKADLVEFNKKKSRLLVQKGSFHLASDLLLEIAPIFSKGIDSGNELDFNGDFDFSTDLSQFSGQIERGSLPIGGQVRQVSDLHFSSNSRILEGRTSFLYRDKWARVSCQLLRESSKGFFQLEDDVPLSDPLSIHFSADPDGVSIHSIEGSFAGVKTSFCSTNIGTHSELVGETRVNFHHLCEWIPPEIEEGLKEIGIGRGYEIKGKLSIDRQNLSNLCFQGILAGKQIQFFDYQFRTLMAGIELTLEKIHIRDIVISDSAVLVKVDEVLIEAKKEQPWTIKMPLLSLEDLRPSLLRKSDEDTTHLSPLIVRQFIMRNFEGLLDDGKTYKASGELSFLNTFKREETFFDLPAGFFGRIIGIDLDLLVPVIGDISFDLRDGYFHLNELKNSFSEGKRSEFFLVETDSSQRVDLRGNLEILVKMKQFVLFALTQGFMISIDGNLSDPHFSLQKKLRFD